MKIRFKGSYASYVLLYLCSYFGMAAFGAVLSVYLTGIGKSGAETSLIASSGGIFSLVMVPVTGILCDRTGRPRLLCGLELLLLGALALIFPLCRGVWPLFLLNGLILSLLNATMPVSERLAGAAKFRYGVLRVWGTLGYAAGAQTAGLAFQYSPGVLFGLVFVFGVLAAVGCWGMEDPAPPASENPRESRRAPLSSLLKNRQFLLYLLASLLFAACSGANMTYAPLLLKALGVSTGTVGTVLSVSTLVEIPLILFSHKFMDRFSGKALLLLACAANTLEFLCFGLSRSAGLTIAVMVGVKAVAATLFMMLILKMVSNLVDRGLITTGLAVVNTVNNLGTILLQNAAGLLLDRRGVFPVYLLMAGLTAAATVVTLFLRVRNEEKVFS